MISRTLTWISTSLIANEDKLTISNNFSRGHNY